MVPGSPVKAYLSHLWTLFLFRGFGGDFSLPFPFKGVMEAFRGSSPRKHWCRYWRVKDSMSNLSNGKRWIDKCKCGRIVVIDCRFMIDGSNSPGISKSWFDSDGNLERVTGYKSIPPTIISSVDKSI